MKKNRITTTSCIRRMRCITLLSLLAPGCKFLGLDNLIASQGCSPTENSICGRSDDAESTTSFGVW